jgi:hypothetical protein
MNRPVTALCVTLSLIALGVSLFKPAPEPESLPPPPPPSPEVSRDQLRALEDRVDELEDRLAELRARSQLAERPLTADAGPVAAADLVSEVQALREQVRGLAGRPGDPASFKQLVRETQEELAEDTRRQRSEAWLRSDPSEVSARTERWKKFAVDVRLDYRVEQQLLQRLQAEDAQKATLLEEVRAGTKSFRQAQQALRAERRTTDDQLKASLAPEQREKYERLRREEMRPPGEERRRPTE